MSFGNMEKDELIKTCKNLSEEHILKACQYLDETGIPNKRNASTIFILYNNKEYPLKYVFEIANNEILKNNIKIGNSTYNPDAWTILEAIEELIPSPNYIEIISPYNENSYKLVEKYRKNLIDTFKNKGLEIKDNISHTVLKLNNNIAEVYYIQKKEAKFKVLINYDLLDENKRNNITRVSDKSNWTLNGVYYVTPSKSSYKDIVDKINNILQNLNNDKNLEEIKNTNINSDIISEKSSVYNFQVNQILYGPPGTGKTYYTKFIMNKIISKNTEKSTLINNLDEIGNLNWYSVIAMAMYNHKKDSYTVPEIKEFEEIKAYLQTKNNNSINAVLWGQLQSHTSESNKPVKYEKRQAPFIFEKLENSKWQLSENGKMFVIEQLADYIVQPQNRIKKEYSKFITFHQAYSYEEFVEGIKPECENDNIIYTIKNGIFKEICLKANNDPSNNYILVIDEINRGNISKIFGELITLIEEDKRVEPNGEYGFENTIVKNNELLVTLPYSQRKFGVPKNLYILGTMNTSDRSIASIDIALRRRFKFREMMPIVDFVADFGCNFKDCFELLNKRISVLLDRDHQIGHSYFINDKHQNDGINGLKNIWFDSILPLLNEYFYGDWEKLQALLGQAKNDNTSFIKRIEKISFANSYSCDEDENYDFVPETECNFVLAMQNAFGNNFEV